VIEKKVIGRGEGRIKKTEKLEGFPGAKQSELVSSRKDVTEITEKVDR